MPFWMYLLPFVWPAFIIVVLALKALQKRKEALEKQKIEEYIQKKKLDKPSVEPIVQPSVEPTENKNKREDAQEPFHPEQSDTLLPYKYISENVSIYKKFSIQEEMEKVRKWMDDSEKQVTKCLLRQDFDAALGIVSDILANTDPVFYVVERHFFLIHVIDSLYTMRDVEPKSMDYCLAFCEIDMKNLKAFIEETGHPELYAVTPTRMAIILEKKGGIENIEEAIKVCDFAIELGVLDASGKTFLPRRMRLLKKLEKMKQEDTEESK